MSLTGARQTWVMLRDAGPRGVHSSEVIASRIPGATNPSERFREVADHVDVRKRSERRGKSPGIRVWLGEHAPPDAVPVTPASTLTGGSLLPDPVNPESDASGTPPTPVGRDSAGSVGGELLEPVAIVRELNGEWHEKPVSQIPGLEDWAAREAA